MSFLFFCFKHLETPTGGFPENLVKIQLDLTEILRISKLYWCDGGGKKGKGREGKGRKGGILLCNGLISGGSFVLSI